MIKNKRTLTAVFVLSGLCSAGCRAQAPAPLPPPPPSPPPGAALVPAPPRGPRRPPPLPATDGSRIVLSGVVRNFNYGPGGFDGLILDPETIVHFPSEYGNQVASLTPIGSSVTTSAWSHLGPAGDTVFDAEVITNQRNRASLTLTDESPGPPPPPAPPAPAAVLPPPAPPNPAGFRALPPVPPSPAGPEYASGTARSGGGVGATGVVRSFNYGIEGEVNGLILSDGTTVYFTPEFGSQVSRFAPPGVRIRVTGRARVGPTGSRLIDAEIITNRGTGSSIAVSDRESRTP
jgi:hypothetical protein